ncbi:MAG: mannosyltransferase, partial [Microcoleus sp. SIO2G3]|nr:mannosyltransferase [Microcoleus sp. SIO2G3]
MTKEKIIQIVNSSLVIGSAFILCAVLGMLINPDAFYKFFSPVQLVPDPIPPSQSSSYYWDLKGYAEIALNNRCIAFYPLWPFLIRILFRPQSVEQAAYSFLVLSTVLFFISLPLLIWVFNTALNHKRLTFLVVLAFSISPI